MGTRRTALVTLAGAAAGLAGIAVLRRGPAVREVSEDLRSPWLYVPVWAPRAVDGRLARAVFGLARRGLSRPSTPRPGVVVKRGAVPVPGNRQPVGILLYEQEDRPRPAGALLWVHGGGLVAGDAGRDHEVCSELAAEVGLLVVSVEYRLAPDHPFPAGLDDCHAALTWLHDHADALGVDAGRLAVGGSSAGGGLSAALAQLAHDEGHVPVAFQLLEYPMLDDRTTERRADPVRGRIGWTPRTNRFGWSSYLGRDPGPPALPPYAAAARRKDLAGLPPAWIGVADLDLLRDEGVAYAYRLQAAGVPCELHVQRGMYHAADVGSTAPSMRAFRGRMVDALRSAVGSSG